jgi:hypothetical protein
VSARLPLKSEDIFNMKCKCWSFYPIWCFSSLFFLQNSFYNQQKIEATVSPAVHSDLWKDSSPRKVDFSSSTKCLRIRAQNDSNMCECRTSALRNSIGAAWASLLYIYFLCITPRALVLFLRGWLLHDEISLSFLLVALKSYRPASSMTLFHATIRIRIKLI